MAIARRQPVAALLFITLLLGQYGCATVDGASEQARLGTVGVISPGFVPYHSAPSPVKGAGAGASIGAKAGGLGSLAGGAQSGHPLGLALGIALAPVLATGGAIVGAVRAESAEKVTEAESALTAAFGRLKPHETLRERLLKVARDRTRHSLVALSEQDLTAPGGEAARRLADQGVDTVLEVWVTQLRLRPDGSPPYINPSYGLTMAVRARLVRVADGTELFQKNFDRTIGRRYKFVEWARHDAQALGEELDRKSQKLAEEIVERLLVEPIMVKRKLVPEPLAAPTREGNLRSTAQTDFTRLIGTWTGTLNAPPPPIMRELRATLRVYDEGGQIRWSLEVPADVDLESAGIVATSEPGIKLAGRMGRQARPISYSVTVVDSTLEAAGIGADNWIYRFTVQKQR